MLLIAIESKQKTPIRIDVYDWLKPHTYYFSERFDVNGKSVYQVRLPLVPEKGYLEIYNRKAGKNSEYANSGFKVVGIQRVELPVNLNVFDSNNQNVTDFIQFAKDFAERASYISTKTNSADRSIYKSKDGKFQIHYVDEIIGKDGKPRKTSMRIHNKLGIIECAKKYLMQYTIPERIAILLHEFSHFYMNKNHKDEFEADKNALLIYCGLGFPRKQGASAFFKVFYRTPSKLNLERNKKIMSFVKNFDKTKFKIVK